MMNYGAMLMEGRGAHDTTRREDLEEAKRVYSRAQALASRAQQSKAMLARDDDTPTVAAHMAEQAAAALKHIGAVLAVLPAASSTERGPSRSCTII